MVVAGLDSFNQRIGESVRLMSWGFNAWTAKPLFGANATVGSARVQLGSSDKVSLVAPRNLAVTLPAGLGSNPKVSIVYNGPLKAPIAKGQHVADLVVTTRHPAAVDALVLARRLRKRLLRAAVDRIQAAHRHGVSAL